MSSNSRSNGRSNGTATSKLVVVLRLSSGLLRKFAPVPDTKDKRRKSSTAAAIASNKTTEAAGSPLKKEEVPSSPSLSAADPAPAASSVDNASDAASTPAAAPSATDRRKGLPGPKPGAKRGLNATPDSNLKPRGKPGPKKRPRLEDGTAENVRLSTTHRLGPKANTGAINAGLRALDRTGAPCRKWERKPLQLKSFTGIQWQLPSWRAPRGQKQGTNGDTKEGVLETGDSDSRANQSASGVPSEKSNSGDGDLTPAPPSMVEASSPALAMAA
ncbi:INO80 complex, subunit Ies4 [Aspergillus pseudodeflectus]|uniref:INO80 complex, subunit Ies4 n=1 Tax=Aspergillus pseudodeflectus TaxID=176178 RepID=A0ABR4JN33_9EURO